MPVDEKYLDALVEDRKQEFAELHTQVKENRALRYRRHNVDVPDAYKTSTTVIKTSIIEDILLRVTGTLTTDDPRVSCPPYAANDKAKRNANLKERWSQASYTQMQTDANRPVFRMGIDSAVADGLGVWKLVDRKDVWRGFPKRRRGDDGEEEGAADYTARAEKFAKGAPFPFVWTDIDPLTYLPAPDGYGKAEILEITYRPLLPSMKSFGVYKAGGKFEKLKPGQAMPEMKDVGNQYIECREHWEKDGSWVTYMLDKEIVDQRRVDYGRPPYFQVGGHMTSSRRPDEMYRSVIQPFAHLIPGLDAMLTMMTNWGYLTAFPYLVKEQANTSIMGPSDPTEITQIRPGDVLQNVRFLEAPGSSKALADMVDVIRLMIDRSGLAAVMYGQGASSSSGYMVNQLMTAAQLVYAPIVANAKMSLGQMFPFMWRLIERVLRRKVYVYGQTGREGESEWLGLGPDDIDGYYACQVELKPLLPMDEIAQGDFAARMMEKRIFSRRRTMEKAGIEQPEDEMDEIFGEEAMEDPAVKAKLIQDAAVKQGLLPAAPPQPAQSGLVGPDGMPIQSGPQAQGFGPQGPILPSVPGVNGMPLVPPVPPGAGMPPQQGQMQ